MTNEVRIRITSQSSRRATTRDVYWHYAGWLSVITRGLSAVLCGLSVNQIDVKFDEY